MAKYLLTHDLGTSSDMIHDKLNCTFLLIFITWEHLPTRLHCMQPMENC